MISASEVTIFLNEIEAIKLALQENAQIKKSAEQSLFDLESWLVLSKIERCLNGDDRDNKLKQLLAQRWEIIRGSHLCYTLSPRSPINQLCINLASALSPLPSTEKEIDQLKSGEGPYFVLMPSLEASRDAFGTNIHNFALHQFVLSDDQSRFIPITTCLDNAVNAKDSALKHTVSKDGYHIEIIHAREPAEKQVAAYTVIPYLVDDKIHCAVGKKNGEVDYFPLNEEALTSTDIAGIRAAMKTPIKIKLTPAQEKKIFAAISYKGYQQENMSTDFSTLTDSEIMRVTHHSALTEGYYKTICGLNQMQSCPMQDESQMIV